MTEPDLSTISVGDGDVVLVKVPDNVSDYIVTRLEKYVGDAFPGNRVLVLGDGIDVAMVPSDLRLQRIEAKLDTLIKALAEDGDELPECDLEGNVLGGERDQSQSLG